MSDSSRGRFIVFEGLDGSGLTDQVESIRDWLRRSGHDLGSVAFTHEPSDGPVGLLLRLALQGRLDIDEETIALLFATDRNDHLERFILPRLERGIDVICDRYYLSFYAYQTGQGLPLRWLRFLGKAWLPPDLTIVLNTPLEQCLNSISGRFSQDRYEKPEILKQNWSQFQRLIKSFQSKGERIIVVDGSGTLEKVHERIVPIVAPMLSEVRKP